MWCRGEHHIVPMCPVLPLIPSGRRFTCLPSLSCAGTVLRGLVAAFPHAARLDALELLLAEPIAVPTPDATEPTSEKSSHLATMRATETLIHCFIGSLII